MINIILKKNKAFTLVETIVYIAIFSLFIIGATSFMGDISTARLHNQMVLEINDQGSKAMKTITQVLRNGSNVNSPTIGNTAYNLSVVTNVPATSPTVFSLSSGAIYMQEGSGSPVALTNNKVVASNLVFSNFSRPDTPNIIKISFTLTSTNATSSPSGQYSFTFNGSGALRK
ncbi:MAG: prepilin-type N-terminal cleavage/methylation domain-containing protein [bacterium]